MTGWRVADALDELLAQLNELGPHRSRASDGSIGNAEHASRDSDHNPWWAFAGVPYVTARDFTHDPAGGLDCRWLASALRRGRDQRVKYVIWDGHIMAGPSGPAPWLWRPYRGSNAHEHHLHLSVVADARVLARIPWQLAPPEDDLTPEQDHMLRAIYTQQLTSLSNRRGPQGAEIQGGGSDTALGYAANADGFGYRAEWTLAHIQEQLDQLAALVRAGAGQIVDPQTFADTVAADLARRLEA